MGELREAILLVRLGRPREETGREWLVQTSILAVDRRRLGRLQN